MSCENSTDPSGFLDLPSSYALLAVIAVLLLIICVTYSLLVAFLCKMYTVNCNACCEVGFLCCACRLSRRGRFEFERGRSERREGHQEPSHRGYGSMDPPYEDVTFHEETQNQRPPAALPRDVDDTADYVDPISPPPLERVLLEEERKRRAQDKHPKIVATDYVNVPPSRYHKSRGDSYLDVQPLSGRGVPLLDDDGGEQETERQTSGSKKGGQDHTATGYSDV